MLISDTLGREPFKTTEGNENCREYTVFCIGNIPVSQEIMSKIRHETENDMVLIKLRETVLQDMFVALPHGAMGCLQFVIVVFPDHTHLLFLATIKQKVDPCLRENWKFRDKLGEMDGFLLKKTDCTKRYA